MSEQLDPKTFDLVSVLSGRDYPTHEVSIYFNETLGFNIFKTEQKRRESALMSEDEVETLEKEYRELLEKAESEKYTVLLKSIPESVRRDITEKIEEEFPTKKNFMGEEQADPKKDSEFTKRMWAVYIRQVTDPEGAVANVDEAAVNALYANAPASAHEAINVGIAELQVGPKAGFEAKAKDANFLSDASPEG